MRKLVYLCAAAALAVPALAVAAKPSPTDRASAAKQCSTERSEMGASAFRLLYGTNAGRANAVSKLARQNAANRASATSRCRAERAADAASFAAKYGKGKKHANAFGNCVSQSTKAVAKKQQQATVNAAKACWTERRGDPAAFRTKYGTNANKSNAFGKCVSGKVRHTP